MATFEPNQTPRPLPFRRSDLSACVLLALAALLVFRLSPIHPINDSKYSMLVSQSLIEHASLALDAYALPRLAPTQREDYVQNGDIYQLELVNGRLYYFFPPGSSVLSVPFVALMKLLGVSAANQRGEYQPDAEALIQAWLAAILMSLLAPLFFLTSRLCLSRGYSICVALGGAFGTQVWSTASRAMYTDTWALLLLGLLLYMLLAVEIGRHRLHPLLVASLLSWMYFSAPIYAVHILCVSLYVLLYHRSLFLRYALTGAAWLAGFVFYSWHNFGHALPSYFKAGRLSFRQFWTALGGQLISPSRGLLIYVPVTLFISFLLLAYRRHLSHVRLVRLALLVIGAHLLAVSGFSHWWGGHSYGPRFTTGLIPWLALLAVLGLRAMLSQDEARTGAPPGSRLRGRARLTLLAGTLLMMASVLINGRGAVSAKTLEWNARPQNVDQHPERVWDWREPQFLAGWVRPPLPKEMPTLRPNQRIDLTQPENDKFLWYGWSGAEPYARWTEEREAALVFALEKTDAMVLRMNLAPFLVQRKLDRQRLLLDLNGQALETLSLSEEEPRTFTFKLPPEALGQRNVLTLRLPDAASPESFNLSGDERALGIRVAWMELQAQP